MTSEADAIGPSAVAPVTAPGDRPSESGARNDSPANADVTAYGRATARYDWVDSAKGLAIILVVIGHSVDGVRSSGLAAKGGALDAVQYFIYTFHMPAFFILSGLFVQRRIAADRGGFAASLITRIAWPYFLWGTVQTLIIASAGSLANNPADFSLLSIPRMLWYPAGQFWYLWALFLLHAASAAIVPRFGVLPLAILALFCFGLPVLWSMGPLVQQPLKFGIFYVAGVIIGGLLASSKFELNGPGILKLAVAAIWATCATAALRSGEGYWSTAALPSAVAGSCMLLLTSSGAWVANNRLLRKLGQASMAVYLLHIIFGSGVRSLAHRLGGINDPGFLVCLSVAAGLAFPMLIYWSLAKRGSSLRALGLG